MHLSQISLALTRIGRAFFDADAVIKALFENGEQGAWYDPSDFSTMFQDSAGATPVTAVEQTVGLIRDKSGNNNHVSQATSSKRPTLSARVNLMTKSQAFDDVSWNKLPGASVSANATLAPDGTMTADKFIEPPTTANGLQYYFSKSPTVLPGVYTYSLCAKKAERSWIAIDSGNNSTKRAYFNLDAGTVGTVGASCSASIVSLGNGWHRCSITVTVYGIGHWYTSLVTTDGSVQYNPPDGTSGVYVWGADLRLANLASSIPVYQYVNTTTDYDTDDFPYYLIFDGAEDFLSSSAVNLTGTNKLSVFGGLYSGSANIGSVCGNGDYNTVGGYFECFLPFNTGQNRWARIGWRGQEIAWRELSTERQVPIVLTGVIDGDGTTVATEVPILNINGVLQTTTGGSVTGNTGNLANAPFYVGARAGTSSYFLGRIYSLIIRGAVSTTQEIDDTEAWVANKVGVTLP